MTYRPLVSDNSSCWCPVDFCAISPTGPPLYYLLDDAPEFSGFDGSSWRCLGKLRLSYPTSLQKPHVSFLQTKDDVLGISFTRKMSRWILVTASFVTLVLQWQFLCCPEYSKELSKWSPAAHRTPIFSYKYIHKYKQMNITKLYVSRDVGSQDIGHSLQHCRLFYPNWYIMVGYGLNNLLTVSWRLFWGCWSPLIFVWYVFRWMFELLYDPMNLFKVNFIGV